MVPFNYIRRPSLERGNSLDARALRRLRSFTEDDFLRLVSAVEIYFPCQGRRWLGAGHEELPRVIRGTISNPHFIGSTKRRKAEASIFVGLDGSGDRDNIAEEFAEFLALCGNHGPSDRLSLFIDDSTDQ